MLNKAMKNRLKNNGILFIEDEPLSLHTSIKIGGICPVLAFPKNEDELVLAIKLAKEYYGGYHIIGKGTNVLFKDEKISIPVISLKNSFRSLEKDELNPCLLEVGAGVPLSRLLNYAIRNNFEGCEFVYGIPGTVGGAVKMNAGSKESVMERIVESVDIITADGIKLNIAKDKLIFSYRNLDISGMDKNYFIIAIKILLNPSSSQKIFENIELFKKRKLSQPLRERSLGCIFKNPGEDCFAGKIIDEMGFKGVSSGGAYISKKHANFIVNKGNARASDILKLIEIIQETALVQKNIELKTEIKII